MTVEDVIITPALASRPSRPPDYRAENRLLHVVGEHLSAPPQKLLATLVRNAKSFCRAGSAGLSLLESRANSAEVFRWAALAGQYRKFVGGTTPVDFSPCGTCLERNAPQLYLKPQRFFKYLNKAGPPIVEGLVVPIAAGGDKLGTVWIISHDTQRSFDAEDARMMTSIASFMAVVIQQSRMRGQTEELLRASRRSEEFADRLLSSSADCVQVLDYRGRVEYINRPGLKALKLKPTQVLGKAWVSFWDAKHRPAAAEAIRKAKAGAKGRFHTRRPRSKQELEWWDVIVTALAGDDPLRPKILCISRDISERVAATQRLADANHQLETHALARTAALQEASTRMQSLAVKLVRSQDDERRSIARELHDQVGQQLTALKLLLEIPRTLSLEVYEATRAEACLVAVDLQQQVQTLSFALQHSIPDHLTLKRALQWHFHVLQSGRSMPIFFKCGRLDEKRLGSEIRHTLFRVVQEALTNVIRHSHARKAHVTLRQLKHTVSVQIEDDGSGFKVPAKCHRLSAGLSGMEERVLLLGGTFEVVSRKGRGTRISVTLPYGRWRDTN